MVKQKDEPGPVQPRSSAAGAPYMQVSQLNTTRLSPPLKWAGGKRWLVPSLLPLWRTDPTRRLVEPFAGGLAVALGLRPREALLCDANSQLINFYRWLQRGLAADIPMENSRELYYRHRSRFNEICRSGQVDSREAAQLFYYLNHTCFNGLCRFNKAGEFNVPFGRYRAIKYTRDFTPFAEVMQGWNFVNRDFTDLEINAGDLIYADPPYDVEFTSYSPGGFTWEDQVKLAEWLAALGVPVIASNQATPRILDLYRALDFNIELLSAPRMISRTGDRTPATEMLATRGL